MKSEIRKEQRRGDKSGEGETTGRCKLLDKEKGGREKQHRQSAGNGGGAELKKEIEAERELEEKERQRQKESGAQ